MKQLLATTVLILFASHLNAKDQSKAHPCLTLKRACEAGGFQSGTQLPGKALYKDCLDKVSKGLKVEGVVVSSADVDACNNQHQTKKTP